MTKYQKFKLLLSLVLGLLFTITLYNFSLNGRYLFKNDSFFIIDTHTGTIYSIKERIFISLEDFKEYENKKIKK